MEALDFAAMATSGTLTFEQFQAQCKSLALRLPSQWSWAQPFRSRSNAGFLRSRKQLVRWQPAPRADSVALRYTTDSHTSDSTADGDAKAGAEAAEEDDASALRVESSAADSNASAAEKRCEYEFQICYSATFKVPVLFFEAAHLGASELENCVF